MVCLGLSEDASETPVPRSGMKQKGSPMRVGVGLDDCEE